MRESLREEMSL